MSGAFDPHWLRLRTPFDDAARAAPLNRLFADALPTQPRLLDLAAGTGANLRHLAPRIDRTGQHWTLADHDPALLDAVAGEMARWPHSPPAFELRRLDLAADLDSLDFTPCDGITANALFDLVSEDWLRRFVARLSGCPRPVLFTLSVDGRLAWNPPDPDDAAILGWVEAHQATDKGFGPALGRRASFLLADLLDCHGFAVTTAAADWRIGQDAAMHHALLDGYRGAALEIAPAHAAAINAWADRRRQAADEGKLDLVVGHVDIFARPR